MDKPEITSDEVKEAGTKPTTSRKALDAYDRARQLMAILANISADGDISDDKMTQFLCTKTIAEALLAIADAVYMASKLTRVPSTSKEK